MAFVHVAAGESKEVTITVKSGGVPQPLNGLDGYGLAIFKKPKKTLIKFSKNAKAGFELLTPIDEAAGIFSIFIPCSATAEADRDKYYAEILVQSTDGSNVFISKNPGGKEFIQIVESVTDDVTDLS